MSKKFYKEIHVITTCRKCRTRITGLKFHTIIMKRLCRKCRREEFQEFLKGLSPEQKKEWNRKKAIELAELRKKHPEWKEQAREYSLVWYHKNKNRLELIQRRKLRRKQEYQIFKIKKLATTKSARTQPS